MVAIKSYNDLIKIGEDEQLRSKFIADAIEEHKSTARYRTAQNAELYYKHLNPTIMNYEKLSMTTLGTKCRMCGVPTQRLRQIGTFTS